MNRDWNEQQAKSYFFGGLSEAEQSGFEEKFFTDADFSDWLEEVEADLIDDYVRGELSATEKMKFEEKYLVTERRRSRVTAATALWEKEKALAVVETPKTTIWENLRSIFAIPQLSYTLPIILLLILAGALFFIFRQPTNDMVEKGNENINAPLTPKPIPTDPPVLSPTPIVSPSENKNVSKSPTPKPTLNPTPIEKEKPQQIEPPQPVVATITLFPSLRSEGESKKVVLAKRTKTLNIRLNRDIESDFEKFQAEVRDSAGNVVSTYNLANKKSLNIAVSTKNLAQGNYKITLKGAKSDGDFRTIGFYNFSVEKK